MNLYIAIYTNEIFNYGDSITQQEYDNLDNKTQFKFWYNTSK